MAYKRVEYLKGLSQSAASLLDLGIKNSYGTTNIVKLRTSAYDAAHGASGTSTPVKEGMKVEITWSSSSSSDIGWKMSLSNTTASPIPTSTTRLNNAYWNTNITEIYLQPTQYSSVLDKYNVRIVNGSTDDSDTINVSSETYPLDITRTIKLHNYTTWFYYEMAQTDANGNYTNLIYPAYDTTNSRYGIYNINTETFTAANATYWTGGEQVAGPTITYSTPYGSKSAVTLDLPYKLTSSALGAIGSQGNHRFVGWYYESTFTTKAMVGDYITQDTVLYARWMDVPTTINYAQSLSINGTAVKYIQNANNQTIWCSRDFYPFIEYDYIKFSGKEALPLTYAPSTKAGYYFEITFSLNSKSTRQLLCGVYDATQSNNVNKRFYIADMNPTNGLRFCIGTNWSTGVSLDNVPLNTKLVAYATLTTTNMSYGLKYAETGTIITSGTLTNNATSLTTQALYVMSAHNHLTTGDTIAYPVDGNLYSVVIKKTNSSGEAYLEFALVGSYTSNVTLGLTYKGSTTVSPAMKMIGDKITLADNITGTVKHQYFRSRDFTYV